MRGGFDDERHASINDLATLRSLQNRSADQRAARHTSNARGVMAHIYQADLANADAVYSNFQQPHLHHVFMEAYDDANQVSYGAQSRPISPAAPGANPSGYW